MKTRIFLMIFLAMTFVGMPLWAESEGEIKEVEWDLKEIIPLGHFPVGKSVLKPLMRQEILEASSFIPEGPHALVLVVHTDRIGIKTKRGIKANEKLAQKRLSVIEKAVKKERPDSYIHEKYHLPYDPKAKKGSPDTTAAKILIYAPLGTFINQQTDIAMRVNNHDGIKAIQESQKKQMDTVTAIGKGIGYLLSRDDGGDDVKRNIFLVQQKQEQIKRFILIFAIFIVALVLIALLLRKGSQRDFARQTSQVVNGALDEVEKINRQAAQQTSARLREVSGRVEKAVEKAEAAVAESAAQGTKLEERVKVTQGVQAFEFTIRKGSDGKWTSPFTQPSGSTISSPSLAWVKKESSRKFLLAKRDNATGQFYDRQIKDLIGKGILIPVNSEIE